jgi:hypothetical protein
MVGFEKGEKTMSIEKALAIVVLIALVSWLIFGLGRNYQWWKQNH